MTVPSRADVDAATALAKEIARTGEHVDHSGFIPTVAEALAEVREKTTLQWHEECEALVKAEWLKVKPDRDSQRLRSEISMRFPDDAFPDWAWSFLDIGIQLAREGVTKGKPAASGE